MASTAPAAEIRYDRPSTCSTTPGFFLASALAEHGGIISPDTPSCRSPASQVPWPQLIIVDSLAPAQARLSASVLRTQPMIGLPSGLERGANGKESGEFAAAGQHAEISARPAQPRTHSFREPARRRLRPSQSRRGFFENGFDAACGGIVLRPKAPTAARNATIASWLTEPSVATHSAASASSRGGIASTPSWISGSHPMHRRSIARSANP